ncbi:MAG: GAF domain-containing protein, partial [Hyphomicrobiaceae bacterium]
MQQQLDAQTETIAAKDARIAALEAELAEARRRESATANVLRTINKSPSDLPAVLEALVATCSALCEGEDVSIHRIDGERVIIAAHFGSIPIPDGASYSLKAVSPPVHCMASRSLVEVTDLLEEAEAYPDGARASRATGARSFLCAPLIAKDRAIGAFVLRRAEARPFSRSQAALVEAFADQAVIAIENARLFEAEQARTRELRESLEYQTAISELLRVIAQTRNDVGPVVKKILESASRLANSDMAAMRRKQGDGFAIIGYHGRIGESQEDEQREKEYWGLTPPLSVRRAVQTKKTVHNTNLGATRPDFVAQFGYGVSLSVPLLRDDEPLGVVTLARRDVPFTAREIALVETFADQAVIAIENARLFEAEQARTRELQESLEYQIAMSDILSVVARSSHDPQPVLDAVIANAARISDATASNLVLYDGQQLSIGALFNIGKDVEPVLRSTYPVAPSMERISGRAVLERRLVHVPDMFEDPYYPPERSQRGGFRAALGVPIMLSGVPVGAIVLTKPEVGPFSDKQIAVVEAFAGQAAMALERVRLNEAEQARTRELTDALAHQTASSDVLRIIASPQAEVQAVLDAIAANTLKLCSGAWSAVELVEGDNLTLAALHNVADAAALEAVRAAFPMPITSGTVAAEVVRTRAPVQNQIGRAH